MKHIGYWLLSALAVALGGCSTPGRQPASTISGAAPKTVSTDGNVGTSHEARPAAATTGVIVKSSHKTLPDDLPPTDPKFRLNLTDSRPADYRLSLNLHIFGLSYHPDREGVRTSHLDNELNYGLGLNYIYSNDAMGISSLETGFFKDSGSNWAKFAGAGYQFKLGDHWRLGAGLLAAQSKTYNNGKLFIAPIPQLTYDFGAAKLNAIYMPRVPEVNAYSVFGFYLTIPFEMW